MPLTSPPDTGSIRPPHPLALRIIEGPNGPSAGRVLDFGTGRGRNAVALRAASFDVVAVPDDDDGSNLAFRGYAAALSTHALLHGWPDDISQRVRRIAQALIPGGGLYATFGSIDDARFGAGTQLGPQTFAPENGDEAGIAHSYFDEAAIRELLAAHFDVVAIAQYGVDATAGTWAHPTAPLQGAIHWFVEAIVR